MHTIDLKKYNIRTDLIVESINNIKDNKSIKNNSYKINNILVETTDIDKNIEKVINKKAGNYVTISFSDITDKTNRKNIEDVLVKELKELLKKTNIKEDDSALIIGLGNKMSTPDALGPNVLDNILVTRHLFLLNEPLEKGYRLTSKLVPSVTGDTGIETEDIIKGVIDYTKPDFIIVIDALAASNLNRVNKTIQMTNAGITPGSGVGNKRKELSFETIGIPVIAIGVPTIVDAVVIVSDTIKFLIKKLAYSKANLNSNSSKLKIKDNYLKKEIKELNKEEKQVMLGMLGNLEDNEIKQLIFEVLDPIGYNMMVTPKEIDFVLNKLTITISRAINISLHENYK